jgi:hypothetical protein
MLQEPSGKIRVLDDEVVKRIAAGEVNLEWSSAMFSMPRLCVLSIGSAETG